MSNLSWTLLKDGSFIEHRMESHTSGVGWGRWGLLLPADVPWAGAIDDACMIDLECDDCICL
jgi:hypothetical protein